MSAFNSMVANLGYQLLGNIVSEKKLFFSLGAKHLLVIRLCKTIVGKSYH